MKVDFKYNDEDDILRILRKDIEISESADFGNIFVDFSRDFKVVGLEIIDARKILSLPKDLLSELKDVEMKVHETRMGINIVLILASGQTTERVSLPIALKNPIPA